MTLTIMSGIPNSGKTTRAMTLAQETGAILIKHDSYYSKVITPETWVTQEILLQVTELALSDVKDALLRGEDVIYDATNYTVQSRQKVLEDCFVEGCTYICLYVDTPAEICIERDNVGWSRIFAEMFETPTPDEGFDEIIIYHGYDEIVDISKEG